jgi:hypothetical protein
MFDGGRKGILGEVYSSNFSVVGQGIDNRLDSERGGCCLSSQRHEEDGLFKFLRLEGMARGEGRTIREKIDGRVQKLNADGECLTCGRSMYPIAALGG